MTEEVHIAYDYLTKKELIDNNCIILMKLNDGKFYERVLDLYEKSQELKLDWKVVNDVNLLYLKKQDS